MAFENKELGQDDSNKKKNINWISQDLEEAMENVYIVAKWEGSFNERKYQVDAIVNNFLGKKDDDKC